MQQKRSTEQRLYDSIRERAKFLNITLDELCRQAGISPSTYSRWANGHNSGIVATVTKMIDILDALEIQRLMSIEKRMQDNGLTFANVCYKLDIPLHDYMQWLQGELPPDYGKVLLIEKLLHEHELLHQKVSL